MYKVKRTIAPIDDISIDEIIGFETESYYGLYCSTIDSFVAIPKEDCEFNIRILPSELQWDLGKLDQFMQTEYCEEIVGVYTSSKFKLTLLDEH